MTIAIHRRAFLVAGAAVAGTAFVGRSWRTDLAMARLGIVTPPANLLRNAAFRWTTVRGMPDYWGGTGMGLTAAGDGAEMMDGGPLPGVRALRLRNSSAGLRLAIQSTKTFVPTPTTYAFSVYLRRRGGSGAVSLAIGWDAPHERAVTGDWQRYELIYTPTLEAKREVGFAVSIGVNGPGDIEVAAPQLEIGERPSAFTVALADERPLKNAAWPASDVAFFPPPGTVERSRGPLTFAVAIEGHPDPYLDDVASRGFDAAVCFFSIDGGPGVYESTLARARTTLDAAAQRALGVFVFFVGTLGFAERQNLMVHAVKTLRDHPAVRGWFIFDEPSYAWTHPEWSRLEPLHRAVKAADPERPAIISDNAWSAATAADRLRSTDVGAVMAYPVGRVGNPLAIVANLTRTVNADCVPAGTPSAFWLQLYGWNDVSREPTTAEARAMAYLVFIWGTRMLLYWSYKPMDRALWDEMPVIRRELSAIDRALDAGNLQWIRSGTDGRRVHYALWRAGDRTVLIACNASPDPIYASFDLTPARGRMSSWHGGARSTLNGNRLLAWFEPYGREVFEFAA